MADWIVHVGDFTAVSVLEELRALAPVTAVHGNMDAPELRSLLPAQTTLDEEGLRIGLVHDPGPAAGRHARLRDAFRDCALVVYGHTHWPELVSVEGVWFLNPGSPTERRRAPGHTMALVRDGVPSLVELS